MILIFYDLINKKKYYHFTLSISLIRDEKFATNIESQDYSGNIISSL